MSADRFEDLSTDDLLVMLHNQGAICEKIKNMSAEERHEVGPKGEASPHQAGFLNALFAMRVSRVLKSRGIDTGL